MLQLMKPRNVVQLRSCLNILNHVNQTHTLAKAVRSDHLYGEPANGEFNGSPFDRSTRRMDAIQTFKDNNDQLNKARLASIGQVESSSNRTSNPESTDPSKPSREQFEEFYKYVELTFPKFFKERVDLSYFEPNVTIDDHQTGTVVQYKGIPALIKRVSFIRIYYSLMYSFNIMSVLNIAKLPDEGLIKVRWRITSKGRLLIFLQFWRVRELTRKEYFNDGITSFYLNGNGKVHYILIEKTEKEKDEQLVTNPLEKVAKVAKV